MGKKSSSKLSEREVLEAMIAMYCRNRHHSSTGLCASCAELGDYACARLNHCPQGAKKPTCRRCTIHCYAPAEREQIRAVMRYSGPRMLLHHPILAIKHLL